MDSPGTMPLSLRPCQVQSNPPRTFLDDVEFTFRQPLSVRQTESPEILPLSTPITVQERSDYQTLLSRLLEKSTVSAVQLRYNAVLGSVNELPASSEPRQLEACREEQPNVEAVMAQAPVIIDLTGDSDDDGNSAAISGMESIQTGKTVEQAIIISDSDDEDSKAGDIDQLSVSQNLRPPSNRTLPEARRQVTGAHMMVTRDMVACGQKRRRELSPKELGEVVSRRPKKKRRRLVPEIGHTIGFLGELLVYERLLAACGDDWSYLNWTSKIRRDAGYPEFLEEEIGFADFTFRDTKGKMREFLVREGVGRIHPDWSNRTTYHVEVKSSLKNSIKTSLSRNQREVKLRAGLDPENHAFVIASVFDIESPTGAKVIFNPQGGFQ